MFLEVEARRISRATTEIFQKIHRKKSHIQMSSKEKSTGVHKIHKNDRNVTINPCQCGPETFTNPLVHMMYSNVGSRSVKISRKIDGFFFHVDIFKLSKTPPKNAPKIHLVTNYWIRMYTFINLLQCYDTIHIFYQSKFKLTWKFFFLYRSQLRSTEM